MLGASYRRVTTISTLPTTTTCDERVKARTRNFRCNEPRTVEVTRGVVTTPILVLRPASGNRSMKPYVIERLFDSLCLVGTVERAQNAPATHPPLTRGYNTESKGT